MTDIKHLIVEQTHTECGHCGYGGGGWAASPALKGQPILTPESTVCPGCAAVFTHTWNPYSRDEAVPIEEAQ